MNINGLSRESCHRLIDKMFTVDQQYRDSSMRYQLHSEKERYFTRLMNQNDLVNWTLLLKIVKRHGWPCQANGERSYKAWIIAWHARADWKWMQRFYPHVRKANQLRCVHPNLYREFKDQFDHLNKVFNPTGT
ncbi:hypothetical protein ACFQ4C_19705 [Larkinella insperata]|uniref:Uncharacterized protein n=1 Tax=Larkinella insperata TaxID=332158 RepID=A0ABW3Q9K0_9BACT|nr:hypothetical protein [Larkinella insperata]